MEEFPQRPLLPLQQLTVEEQSERSLCGDRQYGVRGTGLSSARARARHVQPQSGPLDAEGELEGLPGQPTTLDHSMKEPKSLVDTVLPRPGHLFWAPDKVWPLPESLCTGYLCLDTRTCQKGLLGSFLLN